MNLILGHQLRSLSKHRVFPRPKTQDLLFLTFLDQPRETHYLEANALQIGIEPQATAKALQGGDGIAQFDVGLPHRGGRLKVIWVQFQCLVAVADGGGDSPQHALRDAALMPRLGQGGRPLQQPRGAANDFLKLTNSPRRTNNSNSRCSGGVPTRIQTQRMLCSASRRTVRSPSSRAQPRAWLD